MKNSILGLVLGTLTVVGLASVAHAAPLRCVDDKGNSDSGYVVAISSDNSKATVSEETIAGPQTLAILDCVQPPAHKPECCDRTYVTLVCHEPQLRDAGYRLVVSTGGLAGRTFAQLEQVSLAGSKAVATLTCNKFGQ